jgi:Arc/MetJ family transcription regulator
MAMNDDELLAATVNAAKNDRERDAHEERLRAYAEGRLSRDEVAKAARAAGVDGDLEDELRAFRPIDASSRERFARRAVEQLAASRPAATAPQAHPVASRAPSVTPDTGTRTLRRVTLVASAIALAAAFILVVRTRDGGLPPYEVAFVGGDQALRGPSAIDAGVHKFSHGEPFRMVLRPRTALGGDVAAKLFLRRDGDVREWHAPVDVSSEGAVRIVAPLDTLPAGTDGDWDLVVILGRRESLPASAAELDASARPGVQRIVTRVRFER